jgi:hypothetical protein
MLILYKAALGEALKINMPHNFDNAFEGTTGSAYALVYFVCCKYTF